MTPGSKIIIRIVINNCLVEKESLTTLENLINACQLRRDESLIAEKNMSSVVSYIPLLKLGHFLQWDCIVESRYNISPAKKTPQSVRALFVSLVGGCSSFQCWYKEIISSLSCNGLKSHPRGPNLANISGLDWRWKINLADR